MSINTKVNGIEIRVDKRTELLAIIEIISIYKETYPFLLERYGNKKYIEEIENKFLKYKNHRVIELFNEIIIKYDFSFSSPIQLFLQLDNDFMVKELSDIPFRTRLASDPKVLKLLKLLPKFAKQIDFEVYYSTNKDRYDIFVNNVASQLEDRNTDIAKFLQDYYENEANNQFIVNLIPWRTYGCYGTCNGNTMYTHLACHHKSTSEDNIYPTDPQIWDYESFLVHEFSHSFVNPLTDKYPLIDKNSTMFHFIKQDMKKIGYGSDMAILREHLVRAITLRYLSLKRNKSMYYHDMEIDKKLGFTYIDNILESLIYYENNRDKYNNFESFYPMLIDNIVKDYQSLSIKSKER